jgi:hypothetical protein
VSNSLVCVSPRSMVPIRANWPDDRHAPNAHHAPAQGPPPVERFRPDGMDFGKTMSERFPPAEPELNSGAEGKSGSGGYEIRFREPMQHLGLAR